MVYTIRYSENMAETNLKNGSILNTMDDILSEISLFKE